MDNSKKQWSLYNKKTKKQVDGLKLSQAQAIIGTVNPKEFSNWKAWHEGLEKWQPITQFVEFPDAYEGFYGSEEKLRKKRTDSSITKKLSPDKDTIERKDSKKKLVFELDDELEKTRLALTSDDRPEERMGSRYRVNFEVKVKIDNLIYDCRTIDLSLGGMWIDRQLPKEANASIVTCLIERPKGKLIFTCRVVPDPDLKGSTRLIIKKLSDPELLRSWLLESS